MLRGRFRVRTFCVIALGFATILTGDGRLQGNFVNAAVISTYTNVGVDSRSDITDAGNAIPVNIYPGFIELIPTQLPLPSGTGRWLEFTNVTGIVNAGRIWGWPDVGPDGGAGPGFGTNILSYNGISGIVADRYLFLTGVFLKNSEKVLGQEPSRLDFRQTGTGTDFSELSPMLAQSFFIGDGHTSMGEAQKFLVPDESTNLYLGFIDSDSFGYLVPDGLPPYAYWDNTGILTVSLDVHAIPEPSSIVVWSLIGTFGIGMWWRRRKAA
jgi:hypothetical protein